MRTSQRKNSHQYGGSTSASIANWIPTRVRWCSPTRMFYWTAAFALTWLKRVFLITWDINPCIASIVVFELKKIILKKRTSLYNKALSLITTHWRKHKLNYATVYFSTEIAAKSLNHSKTKVAGSSSLIGSCVACSRNVVNIRLHG